jgi:membrane associated rhomboid family serine protease
MNERGVLMKMNVVENFKESSRDGKGTLAILFINVTLFLAINAISSMKEQLLLSTDVQIIMGKPWTLITVFFSHEIPVHILLNMAVFIVFGLALERITNAKTVWFVYFGTGLVGSLAMVPVANLIGIEDLSAGASAAVFGTVTAFAVMRPNVLIMKYKAKWYAVALFVVNGVMAFQNPQNIHGAVAHAVGIIGGLVAGYWLNRRLNSSTGESFVHKKEMLR